MAFILPSKNSIIGIDYEMRQTIIQGHRFASATVGLFEAVFIYNGKLINFTPVRECFYLLRFPPGATELSGRLSQPVFQIRVVVPDTGAGEENEDGTPTDDAISQTIFHVVKIITKHSPFSYKITRRGFPC